MVTPVTLTFISGYRRPWMSLKQAGKLFSYCKCNKSTITLTCASVFELHPNKKTAQDPGFGTRARSRLPERTWQKLPNPKVSPGRKNAEGGFVEMDSLDVSSNKRKTHNGIQTHAENVHLSQSRGNRSEPTSVCARPGPVAMATVCWRLLLLLPLVCCVPSSSRAPSRLCRRCCDVQDSPASSAQYQIPEVRTVINMTILKGSQNRSRPLLTSARPVLSYS